MSSAPRGVFGEPEIVAAKTLFDEGWRPYGIREVVIARVVASLMFTLSVPPGVASEVGRLTKEAGQVGFP